MSLSLLLSLSRFLFLALKVDKSRAASLACFVKRVRKRHKREKRKKREKKKSKRSPLFSRVVFSPSFSFIFLVYCLFSVFLLSRFFYFLFPLIPLSAFSSFSPLSLLSSFSLPSSFFCCLKFLVLFPFPLALLRFFLSCSILVLHYGCCCG